MKVAICDDDETILAQLHRFIQQYAIENTLDYTILEFDQTTQLLEAAQHDPDIRIMFLDIYMSPISGMELAEILRAKGNDCAIIFVTVSTDHYSRSYEVDAEHYLVKPVTYEQVRKALFRCERLLISAAKCAYFLSNGHELKIPLRQIRFIEVFRNQTIIHAASDISLRSTLAAVMQQLSNPRFLRTHRSFVVNMDFISARHENDIILKTHEKVPLSRSRGNMFEKEYGQYLTGSMAGNEF